MLDFFKKSLYAGTLAAGELSNGKDPICRLVHEGGVKKMKELELEVEVLEERIAPSNANFPPGQFPSGNPAHAPGQSNPNEVPATNPSNDK